MSDPEQLAGKDQPAFSLDDEPISKAYREGAAEAVKMYADEARRLLTAIDEKRLVRQDGNPTQKTKKRALYLAKECTVLRHPLPDLNFGGIQGGAMPCKVKADPRDVAVDPYGSEPPDFIVGDDFATCGARHWHSASPTTVRRYPDLRNSATNRE